MKYLKTFENINNYGFTKGDYIKILNEEDKTYIITDKESNFVQLINFETNAIISWINIDKIRHLTSKELEILKYKISMKKYNI